MSAPFDQERQRTRLRTAVAVVPSGIDLRRKSVSEKTDADHESTKENPELLDFIRPFVHADPRDHYIAAPWIVYTL